MSKKMLADFDRDVGCCSCLGFLRKAGREMDSFTGEHGDPDFLFDEGLRRRTVFPARDRSICRDKPVKETAHLTRSENSDGYKMVNEYVRQCSIGRGSYGKVVLYQSNNDGMQYAIKTFYKSRLSKVQVTSSETAMTDVRRESICKVVAMKDGQVRVVPSQRRLQKVSIMKLLEHPNLINLVEVIDDPESDHFYMVLEYVEGKWICDASGTSDGIGEHTARRYLRDIIAGLKYLHAHDIVHGDIKPENLLVTRNGTVKIGDFSVSQAFEDGNDELRRSPGTPVFTAPECCIGSSYHGKSADVWAVGVTLYCMILGYCPFIGDSLQDTYDKIVDSPLYIPEEVDPELKDLLQGLLSKDPSQRLTLDSATKHPWVVREGGLIPTGSCRCKCEGARKDCSLEVKIDDGI